MKINTCCEKKSIDWTVSLKLLAYAISIASILIVYFSNRSLFLDSLNLARNIAERSFLDLCNPLHYEQSAPLLFLYISKFITLLLGISEYSLRLLPVLAGIGCIIIFGNVLNRLLKTEYVIIGIIWLGTHATFLRYATEFKQYMTDTFISILLVWLALKMDEIDRKNLFIVALVGSFSMWLSMPAIFGILGILAYFLHIHYKSNKSKIPIYILVLWFSVNFAVEYFLILKPAIQSEHMQNFHQNYFLQGEFWNLNILEHDFGLIVSTIRLSVGKSGLTIGLAFLLIFTSIYTFIIKGKSIGWLIVIPILAVFGASLIGKYSLIERLMLFTMPLIYILIMLGIQHISEYLKPQKKWIRYSIIGIFGLAFIAGINQTHGLGYIFNPLKIEDNRTTLLYISSHKNNTNSIICSQFAYPAYAYYTSYDKNYNKLNIGRARATRYSDNLVKIAKEQSIEEQKDVWILLGHLKETEITNLILDLKKVGIIKNSYRTNRSAAILFSTQ